MKVKNFIYAVFLVMLFLGTAHAVDRNTSTNKFNWGDDLSETSMTTGGIDGNYQTRPPTQFKTTHLPDIKQAIDLSAVACGIADDVYVQTDREAISQIGYPGKPVSSKHVNNLRRAIEELYRKKGQAPPAYLAGDVSPGDPILKKHINEMRKALDDLVVGCAAGGNCILGPVVQNQDLPIDCQITTQNLLNLGHVMCQAGWTEGTVVPGINGCIMSPRCAANGDWAERYCSGTGRTPDCWTLTGPECDAYPMEVCSNARVCGVYRYSDGSTEFDLYPCDGTAPNIPPAGWNSCGGGACESNVSWGGGCEGSVSGSTAEGAVYCASCQCSGTFYRSTVTCSSGNWTESSSTSWWCFLGDTSVAMADGSSKMMTELKEGDEVLGKGQANRVKSVAVRQTSERIYGFNGGKKFVTGGHPFWTKDGWKAIDPFLTPRERHGILTEKLAVGDELWLKDGNRLKIESIDAEDSGEHTVYSPVMDGDHTYYADDLLVHNKTTACPVSVSISSGSCSGAVCGNGTVETGEQCDDSNAVDGDGCSSVCQNENCWNDGYVYDAGGLPRQDAIADVGAPQCCSGFAMCYGNSTMCECGNGGTYLGGGGACGDCACTMAEGLSGSCPGDCDCFSGAECFSVTCSGGGSGGCPPSTGIPPCSMVEMPGAPGNFCLVCTGTNPVCGNGVPEGTEACDLGMAGNGPCPKTCSTLCTANSCGSGSGSGCLEAGAMCISDNTDYVTAMLLCNGSCCSGSSEINCELGTCIGACT